MRSRDDLDALRFLAVTGVVFYHIGLPQAQNGFIGVDIFFVLSGFLIMKSIMNDKGQGKFSLANFLERRSRRIVPALLLVLAINIPIIFVIFSPQDIKQVLVSYLSILLFIPNVYFWDQSGYFDTEAKEQMFLHTWSLGIEIQFYILIGLYVFILSRCSKEKYLMTSLKVLSIGSFMLCALFSFWKPGANFFLLPSRIWEFTAGSIIAIYMSTNRVKQVDYLTQRLLKSLGFVIVACCLFFPIKLSTWPSVLTAVPIFGAVLVLVFDERSGFRRPMLPHRLIVHFGKSSYGWFLWHWPVMVYANYISDNQVSIHTLVLLALLTLCIASIQLRFFEQRVKDKNRVRQQEFQRKALAGTIVIAMIAVAGVISNGFDNIWRQTRITFTEKETLNIYLSQDKESQIEALNSNCKFSIRSTDELNQENVNKCSDKYGPAIIVIGDSHGVVLFDIIARSNLPKFVIGLANPGARPSSSISGQYSDVIDYVENNSASVAKVLFMQSGSYLLEDRSGNVDSNLLFQEGEEVRVAKHNIELTVDYLIQLSSLTKVIWVGPYTQSRINVSNPINWYSSKKIPSHVVRAFATLDSYLFKTSSQSQITYFSSLKNFKFPENRILSENCVVWRDQDHFSICGRQLLANRELSFLGDLIKIE